MSAAEPPLALCWGSLHGAGFRQLADHAAAAGFAGITLNTALVEDAVADGLAAADIAHYLADRDLYISNIDPLFSWIPGAPSLPGDDLIARCSRASTSQVLDLACTVGCDLVNAPLGLADPDSEQAVIDAFGALCEQAASRGLRICLEFMPFTAIPSLESALRVVGAADRNNGGIMFDCWHHHRSGGSPQDLARYGRAPLFAIQLDDARAQAMPDGVEETLNHRELPGEGAIDLVATLDHLFNLGCSPRIDVEVFNTGLRELPLATQAERLMQSSRAVLAGLSNREQNL